MKHLKSQRGAIDIILIVVVAALVAGLGGYVYYRQQQANKTYDSAGNGVTVTKNTTKKATTTPTPADPTASWKTFTSVKGSFSVKYPTDLFAGTCDNDDSTVYIKTQAVACGTDGGDGIVVSTDQNGPMQLSVKSPEYTNVKTSNVTVDGVSAIRTTGTIANNEALNVKGTSVIQYSFSHAGKNYYAVYFALPDSATLLKHQADFDTMVQKTLKFQ